VTVPAGRKALVVATYTYGDGGLRQLAAPEHDAEAFAAVLSDPGIAGFDVTTLINQPHHVVGEAIADFYADCRRDDLTLLYFSGHGLKDDEGRLHLAMTNTRREALLFTAISAAQLNEAMDASPSRRKVLILDCCYSGAFPAGRSAKSDEGVHTLERFQGKGRAVLTASDATQYAFEGDDLSGAGTSSVSGCGTAAGRFPRPSEIVDSRPTARNPAAANAAYFVPSERAALASSAIAWV